MLRFRVRLGSFGSDSESNENEHQTISNERTEPKTILKALVEPVWFSFSLATVCTFEKRRFKVWPRSSLCLNRRFLTTLGLLEIQKFIEYLEQKSTITTLISESYSVFQVPVHNIKTKYLIMYYQLIIVIILERMNLGCSWSKIDSYHRPISITKRISIKRNAWQE